MSSWRSVEVPRSASNSSGRDGSTRKRVMKVSGGPEVVGSEQLRGGVCPDEMVEVVVPVDRRTVTGVM